MMLKRKMQQVIIIANKTMRSKGEMWHATLEEKKCIKFEGQSLNNDRSLHIFEIIFYGVKSKE